MSDKTNGLKDLRSKLGRFTPSVLLKEFRFAASVWIESCKGLCMQAIEAAKKVKNEMVWHLTNFNGRYRHWVRTPKTLSARLSTRRFHIAKGRRCPRRLRRISGMRKNCLHFSMN